MAAPINVLAWLSNDVQRRSSNLDEINYLEDDTKAEMLSPYEIVVRSHVMTFLVVEDARKGLGDRRPKTLTSLISQAGT